MKIRPESPRDLEAIRHVNIDAFGQMQEADLVDRLRADGDLVLSLVAEVDGDICGHVALSRLKSPNGALALAPVAVVTHSQNQGLGSALVREALERARDLDGVIVFVVGAPAYYERFGFHADAAAPFPCAYSGAYFMALWLGNSHIPPSRVVYAKAFDQLG